MTPDRGPFGLTVAQREASVHRSELLRAGTHLRNIAYAVFAMHSNDPEWTLPPTEAALIDQLIEHDILSRDTLDSWPGGMNRPAGEPPFYLVGTIEQVAARDSQAVLLVEHPAHHGESGGSIVYADTLTEQVDQESLRRALEGGG